LIDKTNTFDLVNAVGGVNGFGVGGAVGSPAAALRKTFMARALFKNSQNNVWSPPLTTKEK